MKKTENVVWRVSWVDENGGHHHLTGDQKSVQYALEAIEFYEGNRTVTVKEEK